MKKSIIFFMAVLGTVVLMTSCDGPEPPAFRQVTAIDLEYGHGLFNYQTVIEGTDAHSGKRFARLEPGTNFGLGYAYLIPDSLKGKVLSVNITAWTRTGDLSNTCDLAVTCTSNDSITLWSGCNAKEFMKNPNEWSQVVRSIIVSREVTAKPNSYINVMMHNVDAKSYFDMDDLKIEYLEVKEIN
jgi:hypothetical protein